MAYYNENFGVKLEISADAGSGHEYLDDCDALRRIVEDIDP